ncbi:MULTISPECIES: alpha/beta hydrolase [unclassified Nonomuraea]|uniref:alpha/beta fold hydrolase n=1 Tax=unclassified Nonomuraea TaxID=2593643 RepID=UPI0033F53CB0
MSTLSSADSYVQAAQVTHIPASAPTAGTIVLVHGLGGDTTQFDAFLPHLTRLPYDVLLPDLRGHGKTTLTGDAGDFTFQQFSADLAALLTARSIPRPLVGVGISMGAGVLAALAIQEPQLFGGLVFIRPAWEDRPDPGNLRAFRVIADLLATRDNAAAAAEFARSAVYQAIRRESETVANSLMDQFAAPHAAARHVRLARMPMSAPFADLADLQRIRAPVAVIGTRHDPLHPLDIARDWADSCHTTLHVVPPKQASDDRYVTESAAIIATVAGQVRDCSSKGPLS